MDTKSLSVWRKALKQLSPLMEQLRDLAQKDREAQNLSVGTYADKIGITWGELKHFESKEKVVTPRGRVLSALCKQLNQGSLEQKISDLCREVPNEKMQSMALFGPDVIDVLFDVFECYAKHESLGFEKFSQLFGPDQPLVLSMLNLSQDEVSKLADTAVIDRLLGQLVDTNIDVRAAELGKREVAEIVALCDEIRKRRQSYLKDYPTLRQMAEAIGIGPTPLSKTSGYFGTEGQRIYRASAEGVLKAFIRFEKSLEHASQPPPSNTDPVSTEPVETEASCGTAEELENATQRLLDSGMEKQVLADQFGIPRQSIAHILRHGVSQDRINKLIPIARKLISSLDSGKAENPPSPASNRSNGSPAGKKEPAEERLYPVVIHLVNTLRNSGLALEDLVSRTGMVLRERDRHELSKLVWILVSGANLGAADLRDALEGRPLKDSPEVIAMLQSLVRKEN